MAFFALIHALSFADPATKPFLAKTWQYNPPLPKKSICRWHHGKVDDDDDEVDDCVMMIATQDCGELTPTLERQVLPISRPTQAKDKVRVCLRL